MSEKMSNEAPKHLQHLFSSQPVETCQRCTKRVYLAEKQGPINGVLFHKQCFTCCECFQHLTLRTYFLNQSNRNDKDIYCATHSSKVESLGLDAQSIGIRQTIDASKANAIKTNVVPDAPHIGNESIHMRLHRLNAENARRTKRVDLSHHSYPVNIMNSDVYKAQKLLEEQHRQAELDLQEKLEKERELDSEKVVKEEEEMWQIRLKELTNKFEQENEDTNDNDRKLKDQQFEKSKQEFRKTLTIKMAQVKQDLNVEKSKDIQNQTIQLVEKHAGEMITLLEMTKRESETDVILKTSESDKVEIDIKKVEDENKKIVIPAPHAPTKRKRDLFYGFEYFAKVDQYIESILMENYTSFTDLVRELTVICENDLDKCRAIYKWITMKDLNDISDLSTSTGSDKIDSPRKLLYGIKNGNETYHTLFMRLCGYAGLHCKEIKGHSKSVGYEPGMKIRENSFLNTWNVVLIEGDWWPVQCNWGARHLVMKRSGAFKNDDKDEIRYQYDEHYFLTDPDEFIMEFWAQEPEWQLLNIPTSLKMFETSTFVRSVFFNYGLSFNEKTKSKAIVYTDYKGRFEVRLKMPVEYSEHLVFHYQLRPDEKKTNSKEEIEKIQKYKKDGYKDFMERYIIHYIEKDEAVFMLRVPLCGYYFFEIFVNKSQAFQTNSNITTTPLKLKCACKFKIVVCTKESSDNVLKKQQEIEMLPACAVGEWGPFKAKRHFGLIPTSHQDFFIHTMTNQFTIHMKAPIPVHVIPRMHNNSLHDGDLDRITETLIQEDTISFHVNLPQTGMYGMDIYGRLEFSEDVKTLSHACKYLIFFNKDYKKVDSQILKIPFNKNEYSNSNQNSKKSSVSSSNISVHGSNNLVKYKYSSSTARTSSNVDVKPSTIEENVTINVLPEMPAYKNYEIKKHHPKSSTIYRSDNQPVSILLYTKKMYHFAYQLRCDNKVISGVVKTIESNSGKKINFLINPPTQQDYTFAVFAAKNKDERIDNILTYNIQTTNKEGEQKKSGIFNLFKKKVK